MERRGRFGIRAKIALGYIALLVCLAVSAFLLINRMSSLQQELKFITDHDLEVHTLSNRLEKHMLDMETGQRGYVLTGKTSYLEPFNNGKQQWRLEYNSLHELVRDNPSQQQKLEGIRDSIQSWVEVAGDAAITLKEAGNTAALDQFFADDPGKKNMDRLRLQLEEFRSTEKLLTQNRVVELEAHNRWIRIEIYSIIAAAVALSCIVTFVVSGSIVGTINRVVASIRTLTLSDGDAGSRITVRTKDEIRELADATNGLLDRIEQRNWIKTQIADFAASLQGITDVRQLTQALLDKLLPLLVMPYGVVYTRRYVSGGWQLEPTASYAAEQALDNLPVYREGEGLIGQAAKSRTMFAIHEVPNRHISIASGLGASEPLHLLLIPILYENEVQAVVELASYQPAGETELELLEQLRSHAGAAIHSSLSAMELNRLYQESQTMAEELQLQTEELQSQAEELQSQQEELIAANDSLRLSEERLLWQKQVLEQQQEEMKTISRYKSEFMANMSHELRTPLNSMLVLSQLLAENKDGQLSAKQVEFAQTINGSGHDLLRLINEILDLSKVEAGKMDLQYELYAIGDLIETVERSFLPIAEKKGLQLHVQASANLPDAIYTDGHRLQQILRNLLSNAIKFTPMGSVTLSLEPTNLISRTSGGAAVPGIRFSVIDTGIGIPSDKLEVIFEAFQQLDGTTSRKYGGTGLGLTISRELARLLGGSLEVVSTPGSGSCFSLYLPVQAEDAVSSAGALEREAAPALGSKPASVTSLPAAPGAGQPSAAAAVAAADEADGRELTFIGKTILLVEDDIRTVFAISTYLEGLGLQLLYAENGLDALEQLDKRPEINLVIMDIMMPLLDGFETMRRIRSQARFSRLPIIALSAKAMREDHRKSMEAGASAYMNKPVDLNMLSQQLKLWLSRA
ncbi:two-component system, chemotaxis family, sensor kinase CheA [Paenibacillus sp. UNCCL117]|uniref:CHASE3 domain-containing protein n=1 Tax=unclassified Paenibacillus TaxID=185978 RepID=UPI0008850427|nr:MULTISPECIES: CHASE3 domain-containing protein [unclassified Paenibacillus]SDE12191.1 two-component system, chemotaxis family, sensor kinase CheA [Paenibacillus sp. cl123]SFW60130.1 two-component system, chemotaxis family, sensor kinase CheA [Paenibacillus sp. UNCCL117]